MSEVMKKTHKDSYFMKVKMSNTYSRESLGDERQIVLQVMVLNEKEVIVEVVAEGKYIVKGNKFE